MLDKLPSVSGKLAVQGSKITMELPRIAGFTRDSRAYRVERRNRRAGHHQARTWSSCRTCAPRWKCRTRTWSIVTAKSGTYNTKADKIMLRDQIVVTSQQGYNAQLREAAVEMKKGNVVSEQPVEITLPNGLLKANRLEIIEFRRGDPLRPRRRARPRWREARRRRNDRARAASRLLAGDRLALAAAGAAAQPAAQAQQPSGAMQGFQMNRDQPVKIEVEHARGARQEPAGDVRRRRQAHAGRHDASVQDAGGVLRRHGRAAPHRRKARRRDCAEGAAGAGGSQQIKRAEAKGDVLVTQKDQTAKGDNGVFDMKTNTVTLTGNVVVTQGHERAARRPHGGRSDDRGHRGSNPTRPSASRDCSTRAPARTPQAGPRARAAPQPPAPAAKRRRSGRCASTEPRRGASSAGLRLSRRKKLRQFNALRDADGSAK